MSKGLAIAAAVALAGPAGWGAARVARTLGAAETRAAPMAIACLAVFVWAAAGAAIWAGADAASGIGLGLSFVLAWALLTLAAVDVATLRLPDALTLPLIAAGLAGGLLLPATPLTDRLIGAAAGYAALAAIGWAFWRWRGSEGLGLGDAKLLGAAGAWLGWRPLPLVVLLACAGALAWLTARSIIRGRGALREPVAFGAPLAAAFWLAWLYST